MKPKIGDIIEVFSIGKVPIVGFDKSRPLIEYGTTKRRVPVVKRKYLRVGGSNGGFNGDIYFTDSDDARYSVFPRRIKRKRKVKAK
jgi:hypothetical protein